MKKLFPDPSIFVIDDDHDIRVALREAFEIEGYSVATATNGQSALTLLNRQEFHPALIVLDVLMPIMNGWDFLTSLRKHAIYSAVPVLIVSATELERPSNTAQAYAKKPLDLVNILDLVSKHRTQKLA